MSDPIHIAELEIRWTGGDAKRVKECIDVGLEIMVQLIGGFDDHGVGPQGEPEQDSLPVECASYTRYLLDDEETGG